MLDEGRIVRAGGPYDELVALGGTYATMLRRQLLEQDLAGSVRAAPDVMPGLHHDNRS